MNTPLLEAAGISKRFSGLIALEDVDISVGAGEIHALIGPNGAGKTTLLNVLTRIYDPGSGRIRFDDRDLLGLRTHQIVGHGISRIFQHVELFGRLSAIDNLVIGAHVRGRAGLLGSLIRTPSARAEQQAFHDEALAMLEFVGLSGVANRPASVMTAGQGRLLGLARALMSRPKLLLLDEVAAGLNSEETAAVSRLIKTLRAEQGITVLVVEHDMRFVMSTADRITVLNFGRRIASGSPGEVMNDEAVIAAYLGTKRRGNA
jgi:branched-chain amino acid transport system ATP-binding protein